jgi:Family of unknown function (DUF6941)
MPDVKVRSLLSDAVQTVDGKLYILGAGWNRLAAGGFPARHDRLGLAVHLTVEPGDEGEHNVEVTLLGPNEQPLPLFTDPNGAEQFSIHASFQTQMPDDGFGEVAVPLALNLDGLAFPGPGTYAVSIRVDGTEAERLPFRVDQAGDGEDPASTGRPGTSGTRGGEAGYL